MQTQFRVSAFVCNDTVISYHEAIGLHASYMIQTNTTSTLRTHHRFLFLSLWLHGDVRAYDISDRANPKLVGQVYIGGSLRKGKGVTVIDDDTFVAPEPLIVKGVEIQV
jgi:56kDa selenium binding protein (SBP56)